MASCPTTALRGKAVWLMGLTGTGILFKILGYSHAVSRSFIAYLTGVGQKANFQIGFFVLRSSGFGRIANFKLL
jgi:hypothetical protein